MQDNPYFQPDPAKRALTIIDPSHFDPVAKKYIAAGLIPSSASGTIAPVGSVIQNFEQYNGRFDFVITDKDRLSISLARNNAPSTVPFASRPTVPFPTTSGALAKIANIAYTRSFTPNLLNEFRVVGQRLATSQAIPSTKLATPAQLGIGITPDEATGPTRLFDYSTRLTVGFSEQGPTSLVNNTFEYSDNLSWAHGDHNFKFGAYFSPYQNNTHYDYYVNGEFDFYGLANYDTKDPAFANVGSKTGFAEFLVGAPDEYFQFGAVPSSIRTKDTALFAQDDWHVTRNLTVNLGLRYEYGTPKIDTKGRSFSPITGAQSTRFTGAPRGLLFPGDKGAPTGSNFPDKNDFAPRFGFAYDIGGKGNTVVRGGMGVFYDILKGEDNLQFNGQAPFFGFTDFNFTYPTGLTNAGTGYYSDPFGSTGNVNPFPSKAPPSNIDFGATGFLPFGGGGVYFVDPHLRTPYTMQFNLGVQHALGAGITGEAAYVGSLSRKYTGLTDINPYVLGSNSKRIYDQANGGSGNYSYMDTFRNLTNANYNSLQSSLRKQTTKLRYAGTTYFQLSYTFAKNMDNVSGFRQRNGEVPFYNPDQFYAVSDLDVKHRIVFSGGWDLPFDSAFSRMPRLVTKGWSLYPIASWQTGFPLDVTANLARSRTRPGPSGAGDSQLVRVNLNGRSVTTFNPYKTTASDGGAVYVSKTNFNRTGLANDSGLVPSSPTYGTLPRNYFRGPSRQNIDMTVAKVTGLLGPDHRLDLELRADFFNLLNSPEFANPITTFTSAQFGEITSTYPDSFRIIQLAGKLRF